MTSRTLLARLLAVSLAPVLPACNSTETHDRCYTPGAPIGEVQASTPPLPCLAKEDPQLSFLNPGCTEDFKIKAGPTQQTNASGQATCCYVAEYAKIDGCQVGRPLHVDGRQATSVLVAGGGWAG